MTLLWYYCQHLYMNENDTYVSLTVSILFTRDATWSAPLA